MRRCIFLFIGILALSSRGEAELGISAKASKALTGIAGHRLAGDVMILDDASKLVVSSVQIVSIKTSAKFVDIMPRRFSLVDGVVRIETAAVTEIASREYMLSGTGIYMVDVLGFDPVTGIERSTIEVNIDAAPQPIDPPVDQLTGLAKESRDAMSELVKGMATNMQLLSIDANAGTVKTVSEASAKSNVLDEATRKLFKQSMGKAMQPRLGSGPLQPDAPKVFSDIAKGFGSVK
jgi:hypothetical protein